ncbi:polysaccharide deacetylase family protein [Legionella londiniensis]|uniref:Polysaccharide deacetylase n=1 Tax=Legionella londiniensis TaxID=45068 RepID=A0A0W0VNA8_9GAMM|nr:polysaccharide deacetylase family protein [Legionella londiniensis]KTD21575.1 polysaccharide deacetylase [Legionella londiniensis]STX92748.1 polysaccharide deacetylase [Legionella londiniensis]
MIKQYCLFLAVIVSIITHPCLAQERTITITIDDLPFVGTTHNNPGNLRREEERFLKIMQTLIDHKVPATGFVVAGTIEKDQWQLLEQFHNAGFVIGNHTFSHANLNRTDANKYMEDIARADEILTPLMLSRPKYFRYPYLAEGVGETKSKVRDFLISNDYVVAPVTIDSKDFKFNEQLLAIHWRQRNQYLNSIKQRYLNFIWNQTLKAEKKAKNGATTQILLIHANLLNSHFLGDVIQMYKDKGYRFVSLDEALSNNQKSLLPSIPSVEALSSESLTVEKSS